MKKEGKKRNAYEQKRKENKIGSNSALRRTLKATANEHTGCGTHVIFTQLVVLCAPYRRNSATICHHTPCKSTHCRASNGGKIITIPTNSNNETSTITIWRRDWCCVWVVLVALLLFAAQQLYSILGTSEALVFGEWSEGRTTDTTHLIVQWKVGAFVSPVLLGCMCAGGMQNKNAVGFCWRLMRSLNTSQSYSTLLFGCCLFIIPLGMPTVMYIFSVFVLLSHAGKGLFYHLPPPHRLYPVLPKGSGGHLLRNVWETSNNCVFFMHFVQHKCCRGPFHDSNKNKFPRGIRNRLAVTALNDGVPIFRIYFYRALSGIKYGSHLRLELIPLLLNVFGLVVFSLVFSSSCVINMRIDFFLSLLFLFLFLS